MKYALKKDYLDFCDKICRIPLDKPVYYAYYCIITITIRQKSGLLS